MTDQEADIPLGASPLNSRNCLCVDVCARTKTSAMQHYNLFIVIKCSLKLD